MLLTSGLLVLALAVWSGPRRAFLHVHPRHASHLRRLGLTHPEHFLSLRAVIISGHPDRHVGQATLGDGPAALPTFLKREHRVPWKDRLANCWAGFGPVSKSEREARVLKSLEAAGVGCPRWIAYGEDGRGRAFLLVEEVRDAVDLRLYLQDHLSAEPRQRREFARHLGRELARLHEAGFDHPDLCAKHVLVRPRDQAVCFLDWQRGRRGMPQTLRNLALLNATLADCLASPRERLVCLRAIKKGTHLFSETSCVAFLESETRRLRRRRHVRDQLLPPLPLGEQNLIWLDGEALCVTREFWQTVQEQLPDWLPPLRDAGSGVTRHCHQVPGVGVVRLVHRRQSRLFGWLWSLLRGRPLTSPELRGAAELFRLQRRGLPAPRLLAVGQRRPRPWILESFLLTHTEGGTP